jgi:hypothetical protein
MKTNFPPGGYPYKRPKDAATCDAPAGRVPSPPRQSGATLTEVLMALLVMGVGILPVMGLFPVAFLRSLQATNRTHATIHRYNAESRIDIFLHLVFNPDNDEAGINPPETDYYNHVPALDNEIEEHFDSNYVVDPLGWQVFNGSGFEDTFGNDGTAATGTTARYRGGTSITSEGVAATIVTLPDSWTSEFEGTVASHDLHQATFGDLTSAQLTPLSNGDEDNDADGVLDVGEDANGNGALDIVITRAVLIDSTGNNSVSRDIVAGGISGQTIIWDEDLDGDLLLGGGEDLNNNGVLDGEPLPAGFTADQIRIETQERRYTWLLTIRNSTISPGLPFPDDHEVTANVDVAVFFRRPLSSEDERVYIVQNEISDRIVFVDYGNDPTNPPRPFAKRGGFLFDVDNARWYRVQTLLEDKDEDPDDLVDTDTQVLLTLDRPTVEKIQNAIFMRNIIDVYPIGTKQDTIP